MLHHGACSQAVTARIRRHFLLQRGKYVAGQANFMFVEGRKWSGGRQRRGYFLPNGHEIKNVLLQIRLQCPLWQLQLQSGGSVANFAE